MLRFLRPRLPFIARRQRAVPQTVVLHRINTKRNRLQRIRRFTVSFAAVYIALGLYLDLVLGPVVRKLPKDEEIQDENLSDGDWFIPTPLSFEVVRPPRYSATDPEFQRLSQISGDAELQKEIKRQLVDIVRTKLSQSDLAARFGKVQRVSAWWLNSTYPVGPPPQYHQKGLELTQDGLRFASRPIDYQTYIRRRRAWLPYPVAMATLTFTQTLWNQSMHTLRSSLGFASPNPGPGQNSAPPIAAPPPAVKDPRALAAPKPGTAGSSGGGGGTSSSSSSSGDSAGGIPPKQQTTAEGEGERKPPKSLPLNLVNSVHPQQYLFDQAKGPMGAFVRELSKHWALPPEIPPRGSFEISGFMVMETDAAMVQLTVSAWYHPDSREFDDKSMRLDVRHVSVRNRRG